MNPVTEITEALETRTELVTSFSKLPYVYDVSKNDWKRSQDGYGVRSLVAQESPGATKRLTYVQSFEVVLSKGYIQSSVDDLSLQSAVKEASDLLHSVFIDLEQTRVGIPNTVLNITNFSLQEPIIYEDQKVVVLTAEIDVLYRLTV